jgi:hypothetical protein
MKSVLIIVGDPKVYGSGHATRMRDVAVQLKRKQVTVQMITLGHDAILTVPLPYDMVLLDRRDTGFPAEVMDTKAIKIALDNRGRGRDQADYAVDLLPHFGMNPLEYRKALSEIILSERLKPYPCASARAKITLHDSREAAEARADFKLPASRIAATTLLEQLKQSHKPALYFGQTLFEAIYLGLDIQLYPISDYHSRLSVDLVSRQLLEPDISTAVDGTGLIKFTKFILRYFQGKVD